MQIITIIGSRETPKEVLNNMRNIARWCALKGVVVRSGKAGGADAAAIYGCMDAVATGRPIGQPEMYVPWGGFGEQSMVSTWDIVLGDNKQAEEIAKSIHPAWERCSQGAKKLHTRNIGQILGKDLKTPTDVVLYYCKEKHGMPTGGTATAVKLGLKYKCVCINMLHASWGDKLREHLLNIKVS